MFYSAELHLCSAVHLLVVNAGGLSAVPHSDLVMLWGASPSQRLTVTTGVPTSPWGGMREVLLAQVEATLLGFPMGKMTLFLVLGSVFGWSGFVFPSQPARKVFLSYCRGLAGPWAWWAGCPLQN